MGFDGVQGEELDGLLQRILHLTRRQGVHPLEAFFEDKGFDVGLGRFDHVRLAAQARLVGAQPVLDVGAQALGQRGGQAAGAELKGRLVERAARKVRPVSLPDGVGVLLHHDGLHPPAHEFQDGVVTVFLEGFLEVGEQGLRQQLHQHRIVPLEGGEDVRIGFERGEAVLGQVTLTARSFPAFLDGGGGEPGGVGLQAGGHGFDLAHVLLRPVDVAVQQVIQPELRRVGLGDQRDQPPLLVGVVHNNGLGLEGVGGELPPAQSVADGNGQGGFSGRHPRARYAHAPAHQRPQHREEAAARVLDLGVVIPFLRDPPELIQQVLHRYADLVEPQTPVVHPVQAQFVTVVLDGDAG